MSGVIEVNLVLLLRGYRVDNENGYACCDTALEAVALAMKLLKNAGAKPTERLYCDVLSAANAKARLIDVTAGEAAFEIHVIDRGGQTDTWDAPRKGAPYPAQKEI